jgi:HTH-type transcriptional regulator, cell division transcriptional repressor
MTNWFNEEHATFGDRLEKARQAIGQSQEDLAQKLGVKLTTFRNWEDDRSEPRGNRMQMLAGMLNVSLVWLMTGEGAGVASEEDIDGNEQRPAILIAAREMRAIKNDLLKLHDRLARAEARLLKLAN